MTMQEMEWISIEGVIVKEYELANVVDAASAVNSSQFQRKCQLGCFQ